MFNRLCHITWYGLFCAMLSISANHGPIAVVLLLWKLWDEKKYENCCRSLGGKSCMSWAIHSLITGECQGNVWCHVEVIIFALLLCIKGWYLYGSVIVIVVIVAWCNGDIIWHTELSLLDGVMVMSLWHTELSLLDGVMVMSLWHTTHEPGNKARCNGDVIMVHWHDIVILSYIALFLPPLNVHLYIRPKSIWAQ